MAVSAEGILEQPELNEVVPPLFVVATVNLRVEICKYLLDKISQAAIDLSLESICKPQTRWFTPCEWYGSYTESLTEEILLLLYSRLAGMGHQADISILLIKIVKSRNPRIFDIFMAVASNYVDFEDTTLTPDLRARALLMPTETPFVRILSKIPKLDT
jgi:hypothetical protein